MGQIFDNVEPATPVTPVAPTSYQQGTRTFVSTYFSVARCNLDMQRMAALGYTVVGSAQGARNTIVVTYAYQGPGEPPALTTRTTPNYGGLFAFFIIFALVLCTPLLVSFLSAAGH